MKNFVQLKILVEEMKGTVIPMMNAITAISDLIRWHNVSLPRSPCAPHCQDRGARLEDGWLQTSQCQLQFPAAVPRFTHTRVCQGITQRARKEDLEGGQQTCKYKIEQLHGFI